MNIVKLDASLGLVDMVIGSGCYVQLISAPADANVTIKRSDQFERSIPLKPSHSVTASADADRWLVSCDASVGGILQFIISDHDDFVKLDAPLSALTSSIDAFGSIALAQLDKAVVPSYSVSSLVLASSSPTSITLFNAVCSFDSCKIFLNNSILTTAGHSALLRVLVDGVPATALYSSAGNNGVNSNHDYIELEHIFGKTLTIDGYNQSSCAFSAVINKYYYKV